MAHGPSRRLERFVGAFIPPACREEVLGDLHEKHVSPMQYIGLAIKVIPFVILSRIRRTSDLQIRLTEALLVYASFFTAAWFNQRDALPRYDSLFRITIPTMANLLDLIFEDVWAGGSRWARILAFSLAVGIGFGFNVYGEFASVLLVFGLRMLVGSGTKFAHAAALGAGRRTDSVAANGIAKNLLVAVGAIGLAALFLILAGRPVGRATLGVISAFVVIILVRRPPKE
jgi:hypothetical protein